MILAKAAMYLKSNYINKTIILIESEEGFKVRLQQLERRMTA